MARSRKDESTESRILAAAKKIFVLNGMSGARMQDIADEAGINKALLHYYFKNKQQLFDVILLEAVNKLFPKINQVFASDHPLFEKIERFCDEYISIVMANPYLPLFVFNEITKDPESFFRKVMGGQHQPHPIKFLEQIEKEVRKGAIRRISPLHLLINLVSMTIFPFVAKPMLQRNLALDELQFRSVMEQRKKEIPAFVIAAIRK